MSESLGFSDAHAHPTDISDPYPGYDDAARILGCTARPCEWESLRELKNPRLTRFYGVHPWHASEWGPEAESYLRTLLDGDPGTGIGEIGLDSKRGDLAEQVPVFEAQLLIAAETGRPVQIHDVGCEKQVLDIIKRVRPDVPMVLHSFSNESYSKPFAELGCFMSVNPRILARSPARIARLLASIPEDRLLLESDAPYTPRGFQGMTWFADRLSEASGIPAQELCGMSVINTEKVVSRRA